MIDKNFLLNFKRSTEHKWRNKKLKMGIYGFQIQRGTRWNPGLSDKEINQYEKDLGFPFSPELRTLLQVMNGTDLPTLNVYGSCGEPYRTSVGVYAYPRDLSHVLARIRTLKEVWKDTGDLLSEVGLYAASCQLYPIFVHRFVACDPSLPGSPVLSVHGTDAILYSESLRDYLEKEFLSGNIS